MKGKIRRCNQRGAFGTLHYFSPLFKVACCLYFYERKNPSVQSEHLNVVNIDLRKKKLLEQIFTSKESESFAK